MITFRDNIQHKIMPAEAPHEFLELARMSQFLGSAQMQHALIDLGNLLITSSDVIHGEYNTPHQLGMESPYILSHPQIYMCMRRDILRGDYNVSCAGYSHLQNFLL